MKHTRLVWWLTILLFSGVLSVLRAQKLNEGTESTCLFCKPAIQPLPGKIFFRSQYPAGLPFLIHSRVSETTYDVRRSILFKNAKEPLYKPYNRFKSDYERTIVEDDWSEFGFIATDIIRDIWVRNQH